MNLSTNRAGQGPCREYARSKPRTVEVLIDEPAREVPVLALEREDAARALSIGVTSLDGLVKEGRIRPVYVKTKQKEFNYPSTGSGRGTKG